MYRLSLFVLLCMAHLLMSSCSSIYPSNDKQAYLDARNGPELQIPAPLSKENMSDFYILPSPVGDKRVSILPPRAS